MTVTQQELSDKDLSKLVKILELSFSEHDSEALTATRMAQKMLRARGLNYHDLVTLLGKSAASDAKTIAHLKNRIQLQESEIIRLKRANAQTPNNDGQSFSGPLKSLKNFLISNFSLRSHEKFLLENMDDIKPKSKEAYMVLICARRYGVSCDNPW